MNCRTCRKRLYLYGEGEITPSQQQQVEQHLKTCPQCRTLAERIGVFWKSVAEFSKSDMPELNEPESLTDQILRTIRHRGIPRPGSRHRIWLCRPKIRRVMGLTLLVLVSAMFIQETLIFHRVARLENKIECADFPPKTDIAYCYREIQKFENRLFMDDMKFNPDQMLQGNLQKLIIDQYMIKYQQLSPVEKIKVMRLCLRIRTIKTRIRPVCPKLDKSITLEGLDLKGGSQ